MTEQIEPTLVLDLGEKGGHLEFEQPAEVQQWLNEEHSKWHWMNQIHETSGAFDSFTNLRQAATQFIQQWTQNLEEPGVAQKSIDALKRHFESAVPSQLFWLSSSPTGAFILRLQQERHQLVAAGAYLALGGAYSSQSQQPHPLLLEGIIEGFLYKREIDWTATAHREALEKLKQQYSRNLSDQKRKYQEIVQANGELNEKFDESLEAKAKLLDDLHVRQDGEFKLLIDTHENNLKAIENAYDQKLALLKPVKYWNARNKSHGTKAKHFAIASGVVGAVILALLGWLAYKIFLDVPVGEKPQVWQVGVFSVAAFFGIWLERILVRLFISNMHLATDAVERVTMLQTYLSIIREGSVFAPEDKKMILERLFHPATDGLVKDDAAPPSPLEMLSRR
ncbi:MAG: hypothetical protein A2Z01_00140 [Betaproteobacteria bacterium RBG_16_58_11]|nr:MAG: hypothetical protein A2Z01_00140 [Betaproteobacteria bacterium RBG_16_58_11]